MVKDGAKVPIKAAQASRKETAKDNRGSKCEGLSNTYWHSLECPALSDLWLQRTAYPLLASRVASLTETTQGSSHLSGNPSGLAEACRDLATGLPPCRQAKGKKEKVDLDLIEKILDASEEKSQVCVKYRGK